MELTVRVEVPDELIESISLLASAVAYKNGMERTAEAVEAVSHAPSKEVEEKETPEPVEPSESSYSLEDIRVLMVAKNSPSNRGTLKEILTKYDADRISDLDERHFEAVAKDLEALS